MNYADAKAEIERLTETRSLPVELQALLCNANGYEFETHARLRFAIRPPNESHWQSRPDFWRFDEMRRFLCDEYTRVILLQEQDPKVHNRRWKCQLRREEEASLYEGAGYGCCPSYALAAAWLDLQIERNKPVTKRKAG